ncbi:unnamed protein product [Caenorhabditis sp. 36 PRJEB53466]|nr:unnamed protein product [Caenorhabditis sp. 36 PRJEB53466]
MHYEIDVILPVLLLYFSSVSGQQPSFTCPNNANPLVANSGTNLFCTSAGTNTDCPTSSICVTAANAAGVLICCSQSTLTPICPNNAVAQSSTTGYVECSVTNPSNCITGYQCVQSSNVASTFICCSTSTSTTSCPTDFTPAVSTSGGTISCSPSASTCPTGSSCMQSTLNSAFICCRSANSQRICSNNQNALITNGALELCTTPGTQCSTTGYTCQLSVLLATYVCCGQGSTGSISVGCADGRPVYQQISGETYTCEITSSITSCPSGYDCAPSDDPFIDVCCLTGSTPIPENLSCPTGWNPYRNEVDNSVRTCTAVLDTSCPVGFSCAPSSQPSQFICCRFASSLVCINGKTLLVNGAPSCALRPRTASVPTTIHANRVSIRL